MKAMVAFIAAILLGLAAACSTSPPVQANATPTNIQDARQLAQTVANNASCGSFEELGAAPVSATWVFTCQKTGSSFEITIFGSREAKDAGIASLDNRNATYFSKNSYAVTVVLAESGSMASALTPFKN